jgi:hypothetical protein
MTNPTRGDRPATVNASFVAWLLAILLGVVTVIVLLVSAPVIVGAGDGSATANFFGITYVFAAIVILVFTAIQAAIIWRMRAGRNWARVMLTLVAVLQICNAVFSLGLNAVLGVLGIVLIAVATVLMWLPASNAYFGRRATV